MVAEFGAELYDAGHIIAKRLGGLGNDLQNIFPQLKNINRGEFRVFEGKIATTLEELGATYGNTAIAKLKVGLTYVGDSKVPSAVHYVAEFVDSTTGKILETLSQDFSNVL